MASGGLSSVKDSQAAYISSMFENRTKKISGKSVPDAAGPYGLSPDNPICCGNMVAMELTYHSILYRGEPIHLSAGVQFYSVSETSGIRSRLYTHDENSGIPTIYITKEYESEVYAETPPDGEGFSIEARPKRSPRSPVNSSMKDSLVSVKDAFAKYGTMILLVLMACDLFLNGLPIIQWVNGLSFKSSEWVHKVPKYSRVIMANNIRCGVFLVLLLLQVSRVVGKKIIDALERPLIALFAIAGFFQIWVELTSEMEAGGRFDNPSILPNVVISGLLLFKLYEARS